MTILEIIKTKPINNKTISENINFGELCKKNSLDIDYDIIINNCIFEEDFIAPYFFNKKFLIKNCIFNKKFVLYGGIFYDKVIIENSIFIGYNSFGAGISFMDKVLFNNNVFSEFLDINDAEFKKKLNFSNNILKKGTNLLGNLGKAYEITFNKTPTIENNIGDLKMNILP
jgi:hypothetical protein